MNLQMPDQSKYSEKIQEVSSLFRSIVSNATTSIGSGVYELLIRPISIIYASVTDSIASWYDDHTLGALAVSSNREKGESDRILSNYFITRNNGSSASGMVMIYSTYPLTKVMADSVFSVNGITLYATETIYGSFDMVFTDATDGTYTRAYKSGDFYCFNVPVHTTEVTSSVVSEGARVTVESYIPGIEDAVLSSALSGGSDVETDSSMVARAKSEISSWIGSSASIHKILKSSGLPVYSSRSFDSKSPEMNRASTSELYINSGGMIDTYVKTDVFPRTGTVTLDTTGYAKIDGYYTIDITKNVPAGILTVTSVNDSAGNPILYSTIWGSRSQDVTAEGARLSVHQTTEIRFTTDTPIITVSYMYMPYIKELQDFMDRPDNRILGWDIMVKAAVPMVVTLRGSLHVPSSDVDTIKSDILNYINCTEVGRMSVDVSDIQYVISENHRNILNSPVVISATTIGYTGTTSVDSDASGSLKIEGDGLFTGNMMFMCAESAGVVIE